MKEADVVTGSTAGMAHQLRLDRAARTAGEAFAFVEPDTDRTAARRRPLLGTLAWAFVGLAAAAGLYLGF